MKTIKTLMLTAAILVGGMAMAQEAPEQNPEMGKNKMMAHKPPHEMIPNLTEEQKEQMKAIKLEGKKQSMPLKNKLDEQQARMKTLTTAENVDMAQVDALIDEMAITKAEIMKIKVRQKQKVRNILTEEQRVVFDSMKHHRKDGKGHHKYQHGEKF